LIAQLFASKNISNQLSLVTIAILGQTVVLKDGVVGIKVGQHSGGQ
jgi:hypothetical protein